MTITIQTADKEALAKVLNLLKTLGINSVNVQLEPSTASESYIKGDKSIDPTSLFGISTSGAIAQPCLCSSSCVHQAVLESWRIQRACCLRVSATIASM